MKEQESIIYMSGTIKVCMEHLFYWFILPEATYSSFIIYVDHKDPFCRPEESMQSTNHFMNGGNLHSPTIKGSASRDIRVHF
jgi:hypothetical protein